MSRLQATTEPAPEPRPGPDRDALGLGPLDEVGDDQEIARELHLGDDVELVDQPLAVGPRRGLARASSMPGPDHLAPAAAPGPRAAWRAHLGLLVLREGRQDRLARRRHEGAAPGDHQRVRHRLRQVGEQRRHLGRAS